MFVDQTWTKTNMADAALRCAGVHAPWVIERPVNGAGFRVWVKRVLVPMLRDSNVVVMDNLGSHKAAAVRRAIRAAGAKLIFLPPYSPDMNPIKQVFAKLKTLLRKFNARSAEAVRAAPRPSSR